MYPLSADGGDERVINISCYIMMMMWLQLRTGCTCLLCVVAELRCVLLQSYVVCCCRVTLCVVAELRCVVAELRCVLLQSYVVCCCRVTLCANCMRSCPSSSPS